MRFIDEAKIRIKAGHGGRGCVSFRREKFIPRGGPDGGDGGDGADIYFTSTTNKATLQDFRFRRHYEAPNGEHGSGNNCAGKDGKDITIEVPVGTVIRDRKSNEIVKDFTTPGEVWLAAEGGRGGKGNAHFVSSTFQAPKFAQPGEEGHERELQLELKLLADVGLVGFPNAGKSTLISVISAAKPKIADYEFTTRVPNLGVVNYEMENFVVADIPGLIEGAHEGLGLGHRFLKHIERTAIFLHILDGAKILEEATTPGMEDLENFIEDSDADESQENIDSDKVTNLPDSPELKNSEKLKKSRKPVKLTRNDLIERAVEFAIRRYETIRKELAHYDPSLLHKPEVLVLNKVDVLSIDEELVARLTEALRNRIPALRSAPLLPNEPLIISAAARTGLKELIQTTLTLVKTERAKVKYQLPSDEGGVENRNERDENEKVIPGLFAEKHKSCDLESSSTLEIDLRPKSQ